LHWRGKVLTSVCRVFDSCFPENIPGDNLSFGLNGLNGAQSTDNPSGKLILIDPDQPKWFEIVAKGVRNSQQLFLDGDNVVFMEIGGYSAEEINVYPIADLLDTSVIENFGWGMDAAAGEDFGREVSFGWYAIPVVAPRTGTF